MTELSKGEIVATLMGRELSKRVGRAHQRISDAERRTAAEIASLRAVEDAYAQNLDGVRDSLGQLASATVDMASVAEEQRAILGLTTDGVAEIDARLRANEATDQAQDIQLGQLDIRVADVESLAPVPGPKGDKGDKGDTGAPGRPGRSSVGGGVGQATTILSGGTAVGTRGTLNFVSGATVADDATNNRVNITVAGGGGNINSVSVSSGLSITGVSDLTITNTGVRSLAATGISVSSAAGEVTITAPTVSGGAGITVAGSGTTALTVSATGVNSVSAGTGISVSGTTALTVSATGVNSVSAGTGISVSGTTSLTVTNSGVTSLVAGTNVSVSGATGAVTVNAPAFGTTITASTIGGTAAAGTSTTVAREDHKHAFPAGAAPASLLVASTQATGTSASPALADHVHAMPGSAVAGASAVGDTAATGSATTVALSDHKHGREAFGTPVAVTGGATAASGSATTLARSDHVHSTASMGVLLGSTNITTTTANYTFSSISQAYQSLYIVASYRGDDTNPTYGTMWAQGQFNGDTGANYVTGNGASQTSILIGYTMLANNFYPLAATANMTVLLGYALTTVHKPITVMYSGNNRSASAQIEGGVTGNIWLSTAAITSIKIFPSWGNFRAGTTISLYGMP